MSSPSRLRVLVADEDVVRRRHVATLLAGWDLDTVEVSQWAPALAALDERAPELAILDTRLGGVDGFELGRILKGRARGFLGVVLLLHDGDPLARARAVAAGADEIVRVPIDAAELAARVTTMRRLCGLTRALGDATAARDDGAATAPATSPWRAVGVVDPLTGLPSRRALEVTLADAVLHQGPRPLSVLLLDVDRFRLVNERLGPTAGDAALVQIADLLRLAVRQGDLVARYGGAQFVVVLPGCPRERAHEVADRLRATVARESRPPLTVSIGLASTALGPTDATHLLRAADRALRDAKQAGRDRVCARAA